MTLHTRVYLDGPIDGEAAFKLALAAVCTAAGRASDIEGAKIDRQAEGDLPDWVKSIEPGSTNKQGFTYTPEWIEMQRATRASISTVPGQGLPAWTDCFYMTDGSPLAAEDIYEGEGEDRYLDQRACHLSVSWDTGYSYSDGGIDCSTLHARAIVLLHSWLPDGVKLRWVNEYSGDEYEGLDGLETLTAAGVEAGEWFRNVALPAIAAEIKKRGEA